MDRQKTDTDRAAWLRRTTKDSLEGISGRRGGRNVMMYASAFLQKPQLPGPALSITHEDINGFMAAIHGMDCSKGLTLLLHTPGGVTNAAETIVAYLYSKFANIEVVVPTYAMSAGTMISLAADSIVMGRQSQLGPIDPQMPFSGRYISARAVVDQFEQAKADITGDLKTAHVWAPVLQTLGPGLLQEAQNALEYGERMVAQWLEQRMLAKHADAKTAAKNTARHFNDASTHKSHGRRIGRDEARAHNVVIEDLEDDQELQEAVLTAYHMVTIAFEKGPACKFLTTQQGQTWVKNAQ
jgi:ClpP class serine protease